MGDRVVRGYGFTAPQALPGAREAASGVRLQLVPRVGPDGEKGIVVAGAF